MSAFNVLLLLLLVRTQSQPTQICLLGDNFYGNQHPFSATRDPRVLMGTFTQIIIPDTDESILSIDFESPIYRHKYYDESKSNYIFKIHNIGWVLSETASPPAAETEDIQLTCFEDNIINCLKYRWFWGYDDNKYPILPLSITTGACHIDMCLQNFEMTIAQSNNAPANKGTLNGHLTPFPRTATCTVDSAVCDSNRTYWINNDDTNYRWYYRVTKNANWVYGKVGSDRIACAPGYVEAPLFCTTFVYASNNYTDYTFKSGLCNATHAPSVQPTMTPSMEPSASPTPSPTDIAYCAKDYIFNTAPRNTTITMDCPFGWWGTSIVRYCDMEGAWSTVSDDCHLISFTDDFSYFRDELWIHDDTDTNVGSVHSYMTVRYPLRIDFAGWMDESSGCQRATIALMRNHTAPVSVEWDCDNISVSLGDASVSKRNVLSNDSMNGYLLYRRDYNGNISLSVVQNNNREAAIHLLDTQWLSAPPQLYIHSLPDNEPRLACTTFLDWFNPPKDQTNAFSALWTTQTGDFAFQTYASDAFVNIDPDRNRNYIQLSNGGSISSDATQFQFISPFSISLLLHRMNGSIDSDTTIQIATSTAKRSIFPPFDATIYPSITVAFRISFNHLYITLDGVEHQQTYSHCANESELYAKMMITDHNVSISIYDSTMTACAVVTHSNPTYLQSSSLNWDSLHIAPTTTADIASISYIAVLADVEPEVITPSPTYTPTVAPTRDPNAYACVDPFNISIKYFESGSFVKSCDDGYKGIHDTYTCMNDGTFTVDRGCYALSFGDEFLSFNTEVWSVIEPSYVNGRAALDRRENGLEFIPNHPAYVSVMRSVQPLSYPLKVRTTVSKRSGECNNWFIALGSAYTPRASHSILLKWDCVLHEASLFNSSYKRYDRNCWGSDDDDDTAQNLNESLDVTLTITNTKATAYFDTMNCANLIVGAGDIFTGNTEAYLWFGTHTDNGEDDTIVGRFSNLLYTQFYTDFDGRQQNIWQTEPKSIDSVEHYAVLYGGDNERMIAGGSYRFAVPFMVELGIERPWDKEIITITDTGTEEETTQPGRYAHFIVFGATEYANTPRDNVIQIVYDGMPRQRMVYTASGVYVDSKGCKWGIYGKTFDITVHMDASIVSVSDTFCSKTLYAKHDFAASEGAMAMGMVALDDYTTDDWIVFDRIEVYQLPIVYHDQLWTEEEVPISGTRSVADLYNLNPDFWSESLFGFRMMYWVIGGSVLLILLCGFCCIIAWCLNCWPFKSKQQKRREHREPIASTSPAIDEGALEVPGHERFETGIRFSDAEAREMNQNQDGNAGHVVQSTDEEEDYVNHAFVAGPGSPNVVKPKGNAVHVVNVGYVKQSEEAHAYHPNAYHPGPGSPEVQPQQKPVPQPMHHAPKPVVNHAVIHNAPVANDAPVRNNAPVANNAPPRPFVHNPPNLMIRNTNDPVPQAHAQGKGATPGQNKADGHEPDPNDDDIDLDDLDGLITQETGSNIKFKLEKEKDKYQRELFWQRQFFEMIMLDPDQQATLAALAPPQRRLYLEQEMKAYVDMMNTEEVITVEDVPPDYMQKQMEMINSTLDGRAHGEGGILMETNDPGGMDVFEMIKNAEEPELPAPPPVQNQGGRSSQRILNQLGGLQQNQNQQPPSVSDALHPSPVKEQPKPHQLSAEYMNIKKRRQPRKNNSASLYNMGAPSRMQHPKHNSASLHNMGQMRRPQQSPPQPQPQPQPPPPQPQHVQHVQHQSMLNFKRSNMQHPQHKSMNHMSQQKMAEVMRQQGSNPSMIRLATANQQHAHHPPPAMMQDPAVPHIIDQNDGSAFMFQPDSMIDTPPLAVDNDGGKNTFALFHYKLPSQPKLPDGIELEPVDQNQNQNEKMNDAPYID